MHKYINFKVPKTFAHTWPTNFEYNNNLRLIHEDVNGVEVSTEFANWSSYTVGEEGAYITNIFPSVDMEVRVSRGKIKTNFLITSNQNYASGNLVIRDDFEMSSDNGREKMFL